MQVSNLSVIFDTGPEARSQANGVSLFLCALGTFAGSGMAALAHGAGDWRGAGLSGISLGGFGSGGSKFSAVTSPQRNRVDGGYHAKQWRQVHSWRGRENVSGTILRQLDGSIEIITINRPEVRNAIDYPTAVALSEAFDEITVDSKVAVVILTGAGDHAFSAGMDLKAFTEGQIPETPGNGFAGICERSFPKPIIAAVNGVALAGGLEMVLACDLVIASESAAFGIPEVSRGLIAGAGGLIRLPRRLPRSIAWEMAFTGESISAMQALNFGLVNRVVPQEQLQQEALSLAERICKNAPMAVRLAKQVLVETEDLPEVDAWPINFALLEQVRGSEDAREGARAFTEKRAPNWNNV